MRFGVLVFVWMVVGVLCISRAVAASDIDIRLISPSEGPVIDVSRDYAWLSRQGNNRHPTSGPWYGMTTSGFVTDITPKLLVKQKEHGKRCVSSGAVEVTIGFSRPTIFLAKDIESNECQRQVVQEHEEAHVAVYERLNEFLIRAESERLPATKKAIAGICGSSRKHINHLATAAVRDALSEVARKILGAAKKINSEVDSQERMILWEKAVLRCPVGGR